MNFIHVCTEAHQGLLRTGVHVAAGITTVAPELLPGKGGAREAPEPDPADRAAGAVGQQPCDARGTYVVLELAEQAP